ncbi:AfsR/SARP family transcriptional regulator [Allokutzneria sp. NRRL B-24872]|uniref:AfsR/SARP family transcriptional regulator n=1 Tax=Allokutzneria sp. NRRL B-24872 TaxID=1137961 RepID=UPI00143D7217|nr:AfsR/SARP family transcriptional regulator [Allokutzneria sp. NRRL B-24872]
MTGTVGSARPSGPKQTTLLALLLLRANRVVPVESVVDWLWEEGEAPPTAVATVRTHAWRLRRLLGVIEPGGERRLVTEAAGYRLLVHDGELDLADFHRQVSSARTRTGAEAAQPLREALALWTGAALEGVSGEPALEEARILEESRLAVVEDRAAAELTGSVRPDLVAELRALTAAHPFRERLHGQLMVALCAQGDQAEALAVYQRLRAALASELGIDPGPELRALHHRVLSGERVAASPALAGVRALPRAAFGFAGRDDEIAMVSPWLVDGTVVAVNGMAGVGKTAFALQLAHRAADRYPDAQVLVDLTGLSTEDALREALAMLGVTDLGPACAVGALAARWRAELAGRQALVVLDNVESAAQVRPLLPGAGRSLVLVTSRARLSGLEEARHLSLAPLETGAARALFLRLSGRGSDSGQAREVVRLCGNLPLALRIAASRLRDRPVWTVSDLVSRLARAGCVLDELSWGDRSVAAALAASTERITGQQRRVLRVVAGHGEDGVDVRAVAAACGTTPAMAEAVLEGMVDANLLAQPAPGRYAAHGLLRAHVLRGEQCSKIA